jgi:hypothetical protein
MQEKELKLFKTLFREGKNNDPYMGTQIKRIRTGK